MVKPPDFVLDGLPRDHSRSDLVSYLAGYAVLAGFFVLLSNRANLVGWWNEWAVVRITGGLCLFVVAFLLSRKLPRLMSGALVAVTLSTAVILLWQGVESSEDWSLVFVAVMSAGFQGARGRHKPPNR